MVELPFRQESRRRHSSFSASILSRLHVEKVEGGLSISGCALAANCHLVLLVFAFFFLLAGAVLTAIVYRPPTQEEVNENRNRNGGARKRLQDHTKVVGPIFLLLGLAMLTFGAVLCGLAWKVSKKERERPAMCPLHTSPGGSTYRVLPSITHSVPIGLFLDPDAKRKYSNAPRTTGQEDIQCPIQVPLIASPHVFREHLFKPLGPTSTLSTCSDQPFGSIISLTGSGTGEVASFPSVPHRTENRSKTEDADISPEQRRPRAKSTPMLPIIHVAEFVSSEETIVSSSDANNHSASLNIEEDSHETKDNMVDNKDNSD